MCGCCYEDTMKSWPKSTASMHAAGYTLSYPIQYIHSYERMMDSTTLNRPSHMWHANPSIQSDILALSAAKIFNVYDKTVPQCNRRSVLHMTTIVRARGYTNLVRKIWFTDEVYFDSTILLGSKPFNSFFPKVPFF